MSLILGIETATKTCSVAITEGKELLALKEEGGTYSHSERLTVFIEEVMNQSGKSLQDIDAVAVSMGPGSYTGLRIGVSAAKGICYALNKPLISVSTLQAMSRNSSLVEDSDQDLLFAPMIDARRMEVYTALFNCNYDLVEDVSAKIIDENSFSSYSKKNRILFFGDGAEKCREILGKNKHILFKDKIGPSAKYVNEVAYEKIKKQNFENVAYFEPYYLKDFIATTAKKLL